MNGFKQAIRSNLKNIPGWRTRRKVVVLESDDWGSIRMPTKDVLNRVWRERPHILGTSRYNRLDTLCSKEDLTQLFETLHSVKDCNGRPAAFTPFCNVCNPDFSRIVASGYTLYSYETLPQTFERHGRGSEVLSLWREGRDAGFFRQEYHGREHVNVPLYMDFLRAGHTDVRYGAELGFANVVVPDAKPMVSGFRSTYYFETAEHLDLLHTSLSDGLSIFKNLMGYVPNVFVPPNGIFHSSLKPALAQEGVSAIVAAHFRSEPDSNGRMATKRYGFGQRNEHGQVYYIRNCRFEPSMDGEEASVLKCLNAVAAAFRWGKPAVISTHRVNYIGGLETSNRERGLRALSKLLSTIVACWPQVEFLSSAELAGLLHGTYQA